MSSNIGGNRIMQYRSIKEIIDCFFPDMEYTPVSKGNLRLQRCPFCGGKKAYINANPEVNGFICYSGNCGKRGGFISLYRELSGQYDAKYWDIVAFLDGNIPECKTYEKALPKVQEVDRAPLEERHKVYTKLLDLLTLDEDDKKSLLKRGLTEEEIKKLNYKSCPTKDDIPRIIKELQSAGLSLEGIPGFYKRFGKKYTMMLANGFFVPFHSYKGYIQGLQVRRKGDENVLVDKKAVYAETIVYTIRVKNQNPHKLNLRVYDHLPEDVSVITYNYQDSCRIHQEKHEIRWDESFNAGEEKCFSYSFKNKGSNITQAPAKVVVNPRYIWFTSGNRNGGAAAKNEIHFVGQLREVMYLTEGALKADVTHCLSNYKKSFLAVTGVTCLNKLEDVFEYYKKKGVKEIRIALDMDRVYNHVVMESIEKIQKMVEDAGMKATVLEWDVQMGKGIDDFTLEYLIRNGKKKRM